MCKKFQVILKESWTMKQVEHSKRSKTVLVCNRCTADGFNPKDITTYRCRACNKEQARGKFHHQTVKDYLRKENYILICICCAQREADIVAKLTSVKNDRQPVRICNCKRLLGHNEKCPVFPGPHSGYNKGVTRDDLQFLRFRPMYVKRYNIQ